ncbi:CopG family transcriptional regulator [Desulfobacter vibrioformis]|uniref:CopG family transcriptional regulator n=1 Tax=Desulfobacter vibrioformis TaxID=34031 RepID=UPI00054FE670|nr:CopG family transcriptional regulator [Desulfobacter vibrioformis]
MPNVKTAISIEKPIFEKINILAKNLNVSRSYIFSQAAKEYIQRHENMELLQQLNEAYDGQQTDSLVQKMRPKHKELLNDQW